MWFKKSQKLFCQQQNLDQEKSKKYLKTSVSWLFMFFFEKDFEKCFFFVIYYSIAIYPPLVGQIKFGNYWTAGMWLDKTFLDFSWSRSCCWQSNFWLFLNHVLLNLDLLLSTFIKLFLLEKIGERFWRWRKLCPMRNLIYI